MFTVIKRYWMVLVGVLILDSVSGLYLGHYIYTLERRLSEQRSVYVHIECDLDFGLMMQNHEKSNVVTVESGSYVAVLQLKQIHPDEIGSQATEISVAYYPAGMWTQESKSDRQVFWECYHSEKEMRDRVAYYIKAYSAPNAKVEILDKINNPSSEDMIPLVIPTETGPLV